MHIRRGPITAALITAFLCLAAPANAHVSTPAEDKPPITEQECKDSGGHATNPKNPTCVNGPEQSKYDGHPIKPKG